jgi:predicted ATPase/DNA-binding SARP family transcriptional activator
MAADRSNPPNEDLVGRASPGPAVRPRRPSMSSLVGREGDLDDLVDIVAGRPLVTLTGPGGVGKTRLAREVAERLAPALADGAALVDLSDLEDPSAVASAVAEELGLAVADGEVSAYPLLETALGSGPRLLVLDNCEHLVDAVSDLVGRLLSAAPGLRVLVTSCQPLRIPGELVWRVDPLPVPAPEAADSPAELLAVPSVRLFADRAQAANRHFRVDEANASDVAAICCRVDGLPLAIELAAAWIASLSAAEIAERLNRDLGILRSLPGAPARHETLRTVFARSYSLLSEQERAVFDRLGPFAGFSAEAAQAVCGPALEPEHTTDVVDVLAGLVDKSVVEVGHQHAGRARYRRLAPTRAFGWDLLERLPDADEVRRRHAQWFAALAEASLAEPGPKALREVEIEHDNFSSALSWAAREDAGLALRLFASLRPFWETGGRIGEGRRWAEVLLGPAARAGGADDPALLASAQETAGALALAVADHGPARHFLEAALAGFREGHDRVGTGRALAALGVLARHHGDLVQAEQILGAAAGMLRAQPPEAACLAELGHVTALSGREAEGERILLRALEMARERGDDIAAADALNDLGKLAVVRGSLEVAERHHEQALELQRQMHRLRAEARTLGQLGEIAWRRRQFDRARSLHEQALVVHRRLGDQRGLASSLTHLAFIEYQRGRPAASAALNRELLEVRRRIGDRRGEAMALAGLATAIWLGDPSDVEMEEARSLADEAVAIHRGTGDARGLAWALYCQAEIARDQGDTATARAAAGEGLEIYRRIGAPVWTTLGLHTLATLALADGRLAEARSLLTEATGLALALGVPMQQLRCVEVAAHLALAEGELAFSAVLYGAAEAGREALGRARRAQRAMTETDLDLLRRRLPEGRLTELAEEGRRLSVDQACAAALDAEIAPVGAGATPRAVDAPSQWSVRLLGDVAVEAAGKPVALRGRAPARLVKITALRRRVHADEMEELLWPDAPPGVGRRRLNNLLARLRRETGDLVVRRDDMLSLAPGAQLDVDAFMAAAEAALAAVGGGQPDAVALCRKAVGLYRGELLPADRYEDWAAAPRVRLARLHLDLLDALAEDAAASGRWGEAVQWFERGIETEPLDVGRYQRAARVMREQGWWHRARALALRARRVSDELNVELPADLAELLSL